MFSISSKGMDFMERSAKEGKPFYLQLSHYATHAGAQCRPETYKKYKDHPLFEQIPDNMERLNAIFLAAMCEDLDRATGMVLDKIKALGIENNTYVIFTSDNGHVRWNESHKTLRGGKWWLWENGVRVPLLVKGPGIQPGSHTSVNVVGYDFLPTFAELAGASQHLSKEVDGLSLVPVLFGKPLEEQYTNRATYFHYPHYRVSAPCSAIVQGEMKLLHFYEWPDNPCVFNLSEDIGENNNLADAQPEHTTKLREALMDKLKSVGAYFPKPNPNVNPHAKRYNPHDPADRAKEVD